MNLTREVRNRLSSTRPSAVVDAKNFVALYKSGKVLENWKRTIETWYVEIRLKAGDTPETVLEYIHNHIFELSWNLARINKIRLKLGLGDVTQQEPAGDYEIHPTRGFGVEIEMLSRLSKREVRDRLIRANVTVTVGDRSDRAYQHNSWKICEDGSLSSGGMELVSPILKGKAGLKEIEKVCTLLKNCRARIDTTCGLHIHHQVETPGIDSLKILQNAMGIYFTYQDHINRMLPQSRRFNTTCDSHSTEEVRSAFKSPTPEELSRRQARHKAVNVTAYTKHGTCEFRQHSGSIEGDKITYWIIITQAIMIKAITLAKQFNRHHWHVDQNGRELPVLPLKKQMEDELRLNPEIRKYIEARSRKFEKAA
jgi:hypothetical protein